MALVRYAAAGTKSEGAFMLAEDQVLRVAGQTFSNEELSSVAEIVANAYLIQHVGVAEVRGVSILPRGEGHGHGIGAAGEHGASRHRARIHDVGAGRLAPVRLPAL